MAFRISCLALFLAYAFAADCPATTTPIVLTISNCTIASQDSSSYGVRLDVGDPRQNLCGTPSTVVDNTLLISSNICTGVLPPNMTTQAQCQSYHGGTFNIAAAGTSFHNISLSTANLPLDQGWTRFNPPYTAAGETDLHVVSNVAIPNMTVVVITEGINFTAGHIGLGKDSVILHHLKDSNMIPSLGFGLNAGSQSIQNPRDGSLVLGGYDSASVTSSFYTHTMNYSDMLFGRHCPLQVQIEGLQLLVEGQEPIQLIGEGDGHAACIEPYDNLFRLSEVGLSTFKEVTGWSANTTYDSQDLYIPEPGLIYPSTTGFNGSLKFFLSGGFTVEIPNSELQHPLRGLDKNGNYALNTSYTQVNMYEEPLAPWVLGKVFLSQVYLAVDYEAQQIQLAQVHQNDITPSPVKFASTNTSCKTSKLSGGTIAAIVLGVVLGLAFIVGAGYYLYRRRKRQTQQPSTVTVTPDPTIPSDQHPSAIETNPVTWEKLHGPFEMTAERRTSEMESPNMGYAPPSPRAPPSPHAPSEPRAAQAPLHERAEDAA